ncbi:MAG: protein kinase domain-containing protein [Myxococcota bacterium]
MTTAPIPNGADPRSRELPDISGYALVQPLSRVEAGEVYEAVDEMLGRRVAIKLMHADAATDGTKVERFVSEARAMATVSSPHVVAVYQIGRHQGIPYIVMEHVEGHTLEARLASEGTLPVREALGYVRDCCLALQSAMAGGILHRDIKPANIVVVDGRAKLTEFGTARPADGSADLTAAGLVPDAMTYLAPERILGGAGDHRSDMYSLGATLYALLSGAPPFVRGNPVEVLNAHLEETAPSLVSVLPGLDPRISTLATQLLAKKPEERPQSYDDLLRRIEPLLQEGVGAAPPSSLSDPFAAVSSSVRGNDPFGAADPFADDDNGGAGPVGEPTGVMGTLKQMSIVDICHMLDMGKKDAEIDLSSIEGTTGELCFLEGQVVFCTFGTLAGEEAFYAVAARKEGFFRIHYGRRPTRNNVSAPTAFLVLEAMRRLDEQERGGQADDPDFAAFLAGDSDIVKAPPASSPTTGLPPDVAFDAFDAGAAALDAPPLVQGALLPAAPPTFAAPPFASPSAKAPGLAPAMSPAAGAPSAVRPAARPAARMAPRGAPIARSAASAPPPPRPPAPASSPVSEALAATHVAPLAAPAPPATPRVETVASSKAAGHPSVPATSAPSRGRQLAVAAVLVVVLATLAIGFTWLRQPSLERIDGGEAAEVLAQLDAIAPAERTLRDELWRGHALVQLGRQQEAYGAYGAAAKLGELDERALGLAFAALGEPNPAAALDLLGDQRSDAVTKRLLERTLDESWAVRRNALQALGERGAKERANFEAIAIKDLLTGPSCVQRRIGLLDLEKYGRSENAREAFQQALSRKATDNACMARDLERLSPK